MDTGIICEDCGLEIHRFARACSCGWQIPNKPRRDQTPISDLPVNEDSSDMGRRCLKLMGKLLSNEIDREEYLDGLEKLNHDFPDTGFAVSIHTLTRYYNEIPRNLEAL